jgi:hypothetical protein
MILNQLLLSLFLLLPGFKRIFMRRTVSSFFLYIFLEINFHEQIFNKNDTSLHTEAMK